MKEHYRVAVLGAGFSGLCVGANLKRRGHHDFAIFEKADAVGGTWRENTYPGVACDVPSHLYSLSFDLNPDWTREYSSGQEIQAYIERAAVKFGLRPHLRFRSEVVSLRWESERWQVALKSGETVSANVVVAGLGGLHVPKHPEIPGLDVFPGKVMHSAEWDHAHDFRGSRVAVIGTGSSAVQLIPELRRLADRLFVFQRTPAWVLPRFDREIGSTARARYRNIPGYMHLARWARCLIREIWGALYVRRGRAHDFFEAQARRAMERRIADPELRAKLIPDYALGCKRPCISDDYLEALQQDNVELVTEEIERIEGNTIHTRDGACIPVDSIVAATGFRPFDITTYVDIRGVDGASLAETWAQRVEAHRTMMVPSFPNFYLMLGPNSGLGHNSVLHMIEAQTRYVLAALRHMDRNGVRVLDPRPEAFHRFNNRLQDAMKRVVFGGGCNAWYTDEHDHNFTLWPGSIWSYWLSLSRLDATEFKPPGL